jgi:hypothetical protein
MSRHVRNRIAKLIQDLQDTSEVVLDFLRLWVWDFTPNPWVHSVSFGSQGPVRLTNGRRSSKHLDGLNGRDKSTSRAETGPQPARAP